jgi:hypothetical protein
MSVSNVTPVAASTLSYADEFSFEVTAGYTSLQVKVTVMGGGLEAAYDDGVGAGYTVTIDDLGATHRFTVKRDSGWSISPTTVNVVEDGAVTTWTYEVFPTASYPEGMQPYNGIGADVSNLVTSWNSRTGNVVPVASDYDASQVDNDSGVAGATVKDALDQLDADVGAITPHPVDSVHGRTGAVVSAKDDYNAGEVTVNVLGIPDIDTVQEVIDHTLGVGHIHGGELIDNGDGTVQIAGGAGFLRSTDDDTAPVYSMEWVGDAAVALTDNNINFIYVEYNAGTPQLAVSTTRPTDLNTNLLLWSVYRSGLFIHETPNRYDEANLAREVNRRLYNVEGTTHSTGCAISETGTRNIALTAGTFYLGLNVAEWSAVDTSVADTFLYFYGDGVGGWTVVPASTQIDNLQYDDGSGTLATLSNNRYGVHWVYVSPHDQDTYVLYGTGDYTRTQAEQAAAPSSLPPHLDYWHGTLAGKIIVQKSAASLFTVESAFTKLFLSGGASVHADLTGLTADDHPQYARTDGTRNQVEVLLDEETTKTGTPSATQAIFWADDHANGQRLRWSRGRYPDDFVIPFANSFSNTALVYWSGVTGQQTSSSLFTYSSADGRLWMNQAGAGLRIKESAALTSLPGAANGTYWVKNDVPATPQFTGDDDVAHQLAYDEDVIKGPSSSTDDRIVTFDGTTGKLVQEAFGAKATTLGITLDLANQAFVAKERASGPTGTASWGYIWVKSDVPTTPWFTDDSGAHNQFAYKADHPDVDGTVLQDAVYFTDRADHVNAPGGAKSELWTRTATIGTSPLTATT